MVLPDSFREMGARRNYALTPAYILSSYPYRFLVVLPRNMTFCFVLMFLKIFLLNLLCSLLIL